MSGKPKHIPNKDKRFFRGTNGAKPGSSGTVTSEAAAAPTTTPVTDESIKAKMAAAAAAPTITPITDESIKAKMAEESRPDNWASRAAKPPAAHSSPLIPPSQNFRRGVAAESRDWASRTAKATADSLSPLIPPSSGSDAHSILGTQRVVVPGSNYTFGSSEHRGKKGAKPGSAGTEASGTSSDKKYSISGLPFIGKSAPPAEGVSNESVKLAAQQAAPETGSAKPEDQAAPYKAALDRRPTPSSASTQSGPLMPPRPSLPVYTIIKKDKTEMKKLCIDGKEYSGLTPNLTGDLSPRFIELYEYSDATTLANEILYHKALPKYLGGKDKRWEENIKEGGLYQRFSIKGLFENNLQLGSPDNIRYNEVKSSITANITNAARNILGKYSAIIKKYKLALVYSPNLTVVNGKTVKVSTVRQGTAAGLSGQTKERDDRNDRYLVFEIISDLLPYRHYEGTISGQKKFKHLYTKSFGLTFVYDAYCPSESFISDILSDYPNQKSFFKGKIFANNLPECAELITIDSKTSSPFSICNINEIKKRMFFYLDKDNFEHCTLLEALINILVEISRGLVFDTGFASLNSKINKIMDKRPPLSDASLCNNKSLNITNFDIFDASQIIDKTIASDSSLEQFLVESLDDTMILNEDKCDTIKNLFDTLCNSSIPPGTKQTLISEYLTLPANKQHTIDYNRNVLRGLSQNILISSDGIDRTKLIIDLKKLLEDASGLEKTQAKAQLKDRLEKAFSGDYGAFKAPVSLGYTGAKILSTTLRNSHVISNIEKIFDEIIDYISQPINNDVVIDYKLALDIEFSKVNISDMRQQKDENMRYIVFNITSTFKGVDFGLSFVYDTIKPCESIMLDCLWNFVGTGNMLLKKVSVCDDTLKDYMSSGEFDIYDKSSSSYNPNKFLFYIGKNNMLLTIMTVLYSKLSGLFFTDDYKELLDQNLKKLIKTREEVPSRFSHCVHKDYNITTIDVVNLSIIKNTILGVSTLEELIRKAAITTDICSQKLKHLILSAMPTLRKTMGLEEIAPSTVKKEWGTGNMLEVIKAPTLVNIKTADGEIKRKMLFGDALRLIINDGATELVEDGEVRQINLSEIKVRIETPSKIIMICDVETAIEEIVYHGAQEIVPEGASKLIDVSKQFTKLGFETIQFNRGTRRNEVLVELVDKTTGWSIGEFTEEEALKKVLEDDNIEEWVREGRNRILKPEIIIEKRRKLEEERLAKESAKKKEKEDYKAYLDTLTEEERKKEAKRRAIASVFGKKTKGGSEDIYYKKYLKYKAKYLKLKNQF